MESIVLDQINPNISSSSIAQLSTSKCWTRLSKFDVTWSYLPTPEELLASSSLQNSVFLRHYLTGPCVIHDSDLMALAQSCPNLRFIDVVPYESLEAVLIMKSSSYRCEYLNLSQIQDFTNPEEFWGQLEKCSNLKSVRVGSSFSQLSHLTKLQNLTTLQIYSTEKLDWTDFNQFIRPGVFPKIKHLEININELPETKTPSGNLTRKAFLVAWAHACPNLTWLVVRLSSDCRELSSFIQLCPDLEKLTISGDFSNQEAESLQDHICTRQSKLQYLSFWNLRISETIAQKIICRSVSLLGVNVSGLLFIKENMIMNHLETLLLTTKYDVGLGFAVDALQKISQDKREQGLRIVLSFREKMTSGGSV